MALPEPFASIPKTSLLLPTPSPIHALARISADLGGRVQLWAKREDLNSPLGSSGNKLRKLEYVLADAIAKGATTLVSIGGVQSNHTRQVAAAAAAHGLQAKLIQKHWVKWEGENPASDALVGNIQLSKLMGAETIMNPDGFSITDTSEDSAAVKEIMDAVRRDGGVPYWIPAGASDHPLGGLGFAAWAFEVAAQEEEMGVFFDTVIVCAVTGSTFGGMIAGFKLLEARGGRKRKVLGIDASATPDATFAQVLKIARFTAVKIRLTEYEISEEDVHLDRRYHGPAYGIPDLPTLDAIKYGASMEAFITDPVYEGKSLAGMLDMVRKGEISSGNVLYAHLGGQLALNVYGNMDKVLGVDA